MRNRTKRRHYPPPPRNDLYWLNEAMSLLGPIYPKNGWLWFDGQRFYIQIGPDGGLLRIEPAIRQSAKRLGLNKHQRNLFYEKVFKTVDESLRDV